MAPSSSAKPAYAVPAIIAGFPTQVEAYDVQGTMIGLVTVRDLEQHVDREQMLHDESSVPPYWALVWGGARALADHLVTRLSCDGLTVLDVGCGSSKWRSRRRRRSTHRSRARADRVPLASAAVNRLLVEALVGASPPSIWRAASISSWRRICSTSAEFERLAASLRGGGAGRDAWVADPQRVDTAEFYRALDRCGFSIREVCVCDVREESTFLRVRLVALGRAAT
jgi:hypothetical protein